MKATMERRQRFAVSMYSVQEWKESRWKRRIDYNQHSHVPCGGARYGVQLMIRRTAFNFEGRVWIDYRWRYGEYDVNQGMKVGRLWRGRFDECRYVGVTTKLVTLPT